MDMRAIANQFRVLATEPANREFMVHTQNCLPALVTFLHVADAECVMIAMETIQYLSLNAKNHARIAGEAPLMTAVAAWGTRTGADPRIIALSRAISHNVADDGSEYESDDEAPAPAAAASNAAAAVPATATATATATTTAAATATAAAATPTKTVSTGGSCGVSSSATPFSPLAEKKVLQATTPTTASRYMASPCGAGSASRSRAFTLKIDGLNESNQAFVERKLLETYGVVSFTINTRAERAVVRMSCEPEVVIAAIEAIGYHATIEGDESAGLETVRADKENMPGYAASEHVNSRYTVVNNMGDFSLAGRQRAAERREKAKQTKVTSLLSKVGSWLW